MTDNLRDRIAAVFARHVEDQLTNYDAGRTECGCGHQGDETYRQHLADAVIAELGLREELRYPNRQPRWSSMPPQRRRYVTEWENNE